MIENIWEKHEANIIPTIESLNASPKMWNKTRMSTPLIPFNKSLDVLASAIRQEK